MKSIRRDIQIEPGSYTSLRLRMKAAGQPFDLTGWDACLQARDYNGELLIDLTQDNGGIEITPVAGEVTLHLFASTTAGIREKTAYYDLKLIPSDPERAIEIYNGQITFGREDCQ